MVENRLTIPRTARYYTLGGSGQAVREVWFVVHGYGQLAVHFLRPFEGVDDGSRLFVAPEALSRFYLQAGQGRVGASWMTREDRQAEIDDYLGYLDALHDHVFEDLDRAAVQLHVLGFSQGVATACRWAALGHVQVDRLICWAGEIPPDLDLEVHHAVFAAADLTLAIGTEDEFISEARVAKEVARLQQHEIPHRLLRFHGTHQIDAGTLQELALGRVV